MLKVLINEEEVLTNKDFTIKKEMLNTPSVILNNVYPKTWEDTKDYTSNFYHPQDYSKCKIIDENIVPAEPGETISGTSFTIQDYDSTKLNELTELDGNTTQSGTPTPTSPQPINVVSGRQEVDIVGKNLFNSTIQEGTYNDAVYTIDEDGKINQSASDDSSWNSSQKRCFTLDEGTYTIQIIGKAAATRIQVRNLTDNTNIIENTNDINTFILNGTKTLAIKTWGNSSYYPASFYIMLVKGSYTSSTMPPYEIYNEITTEINLGKNLFDSSQLASQYNYQCTTSITNNVMTISSTATSGVSFTRLLPTITLKPNTTYTASLDYIGDLNQMRIYDVVDNSYISFTQAGTGRISGTFTTGNNTQYRLVVYVIIEKSVEISNIQIEEGSQATSYSPYKTPIELCKINTYKDRIYKENGTWYLHKEIGKVVLDGSENWTEFNSVAGSSGTLSQIGRVMTFKTREGISNNFAVIPNYTPTEHIVIGGGLNRLYVQIANSRLSSVDIAGFKTWLSTHNTIVYYVLATPTTTEITDTELISQLNAIELLEGLNNVSVGSADLPGEITIHYNYTEEQTIDDLLFCGVVKNSGNISLNPREPHFQSLQILDFKTFLSEGELDSFVIYQKTILEAIQMVIANIQDYGFILGNVNILNPTDVIGAYSTKDKTAYDVFNYIADITQSRWTTRLIDENHVAIDFYDPTLMVEGTPINYNQTFFENNLIDDMTYSYGSSNYRNKQVMTSSQVYSNISQQQSIVANGYQTQFPTEQPIGKINSITSNGIPLTFATFNEKEMGYVADFYYSPGDNYFESEDLRSTGEILIIDYVAIVEGRQIITNPLEIDRINDSTGRKGIISRYEQRNDATTSTELQKIGESYIKYKGTPEIKLKISTRKNIWEVGQRVQFNAPIEELDTEYMVRTKKINYTSTIDTIFYEYELISSFNSETEINYFDNQRAKATGNIGEGEYISRNIDIESTANIIFYDTETTEVQVDGDNELNSILNSPFIS